MQDVSEKTAETGGSWRRFWRVFHPSPDFKDGSCRRIRSREEGRVVDSYTLSEILQSHDAISKPKWMTHHITWFVIEKLEYNLRDQGLALLQLFETTIIKREISDASYLNIELNFSEITKTNISFSQKIY